ncbi:hypothetical protein T484DRAFT_1967146 [Baffinella frigidus]|nr:hypothetical protein T484DRAFT_1967146 [Cryptophyta sp. CCMP2293]
MLPFGSHLPPQGKGFSISPGGKALRPQNQPVLEVLELLPTTAGPQPSWGEAPRAGRKEPSPLPVSTPSQSGDHVGIAGAALHTSRPTSMIEATNGSQQTPCRGLSPDPTPSATFPSRPPLL